MCCFLCVCFRLKGVSADQEESLLQQLTEITRVMQEGQLVDDVTPEKKSQDDWEGTRALRHCRNYNLQEKKTPLISPLQRFVWSGAFKCFWHVPSSNSRCVTMLRLRPKPPYKCPRSRVPVLSSSLLLSLLT